MTYGSEPTSWSNAYSNGADTEWPRAIPCISSSPWAICGAMECEQPSAKTMPRCESPSTKELFLEPHPNAPSPGRTHPFYSPSAAPSELDLLFKGKQLSQLEPLQTATYPSDAGLLARG